jgi:FkbM family methyltransferase
MLVTAEAYGLRLLVPQNDAIIGACLREHGEFARSEVDLIRACLRSQGPGTIIDVGANLGAICLPLAAELPEWRVIGAEASRVLANVLAANAIGNRLLNVEVMHVALGPRLAVALFDSPPLGTSMNFGVLRVREEPGEWTEKVLMRPLDEIAPADTRFVKIDVEGFELQVLRGSNRVLNDLRPGWLIEAHPLRENQVRECLRLFFDAGYRAYFTFAPFVTPGPSAGGGALKGDQNLLVLPQEMAAPEDWGWPEITSPTLPWPMQETVEVLKRRYSLAR